MWSEEDTVDVRKWVPAAARLIQKFCDPALEHKRTTVQQMAMITPLQALTPPEKRPAQP